MGLRRSVINIYFNCKKKKYIFIILLFDLNKLNIKAILLLYVIFIRALKQG